MRSHARDSTPLHHTFNARIEVHNERLSDIDLRVTRYAFSNDRDLHRRMKFWRELPGVDSARMCYYAALNLRTMQPESLPE